MRLTRIVALATVLVVSSGCSNSSAGTPLLEADEAVEGFVDAPPPLLDAVGLDGPRELEGESCITTAEVTAGGATAAGPRWLLTLTLSETPSDDAALGAMLADTACDQAVRGERDRALTALGAVGPNTMDITFVDPDGRRWLPGS